MIWYNLKIVFRNLVNNKLYSSLSIAGFSIGFAVCIVIALFAYNEYTVDQCYPNSSRIYRLVDAKDKQCDFDYNLNKVLSDNNPEIELACAFEGHANRLSVKSEKRYAQSFGLISTTNSFFRIFSVRVIKAIAKEPFSDKQSAVITASLAKKLFKEGEEPLGMPINISNSVDATISAIVEDLPVNSSIRGNVFLNSENEEFRMSQSCENDKCINTVNHYLLLNQKINQTNFSTKLNQGISTYKFAIDSIGLQKLLDIYLDTTIQDRNDSKGNKNLVLMFMAIGMLIMMLSIINYLNYNLSLQYSKLREVGIKRINGASYRHLIGYYLTDVSVGIIISVDIALLIVGLFIANINSLLHRQLNLNVLFHPSIMIFSFGVIILIILINSIAPMYILSRFNLNSIYSGKKPAGGKLIGRNILTAFQFTTAIALLSCVLIIQKQLIFAQDADLGFKKENLLKLSFPADFKQQLTLKREVNKLPFVISSTLSHGGPGEINWWMGSGDTTTKSFSLATITVDDDFIKTMDIELLDGRWFLNGDKGTTCVMNQEAIQQFGWRDIDNKRFNNGREGGYQVVGVVKDFHVGSFHQAMLPTCLLSCTTQRFDGLTNLSIRITPGDVESKLQQIEKVWKKIIPDDPMEFTFYDSFFDTMYRKERLLAAIIMIFSAIAIVLSCMGILGQVFQTCINRTKEIGVRKVNGASTFTIIQMLNFDFIKLIIIAFLIASPLSYFIMNKWLQNFAFKTEMSWWLFALAGVVILIISVVTVTWHSWRVANRNPVEVLRYE